MILKQTIDVWNEYHEGAKVFEDLAKAKEWAISRMMELLLLPIGHKDTRRVRRRIIKYNQELFTFLDNPLVGPTNNRAKAAIKAKGRHELKKPRLNLGIKITLSTPKVENTHVCWKNLPLPLHQAMGP